MGNAVSQFAYPEPRPILCKDSASRVENKILKLVSNIFYSEPQPILRKDNARRVFVNK